MTIEADIVSKLNALGIFSKVRYLIAESTQDNDPIEMPFFILGGATVDNSVFRTFCGVALVVNQFEAILGAATSTDLNDFTNQAIAAIADIATVTSTVADYDEQGGFYFSTLSITAI